MESSNTNNVLKRAGNELSGEASTSKQPYIDNRTMGANIEASGHSRVNIGPINVTKYETHQQPRTKEPLRGIRIQVAEPVASFGGRDKELESVQRAFEEQSNMQRYNLVAVCGYGGIGKTEFVKKFIQNLPEDFTVIWINSEIDSTIEDSFNKLQKELERRGYPCTGHQDVYKHFNNSKCLFVFDNADNMKSISAYLPQQHNNSLFLITSQYRTWSPHKSVALDELDRASAINIVNVILRSHDIQISKRQQQKLLSTLEPIPLVLQIGVGFVCQEVLGFKDIGKEYNIDDIIGELSAECELVTLEFPPFDQNLYDKSVLVAVSRTLEKFWHKEDDVSKTTKNMLGVAAYLNADGIKEHILKELLNMEHEKFFSKSLTILAQFSLFQISIRKRLFATNTRIYTMHRTVQECVRHLCRKSNECYLLSLRVLLNKGYSYQQHHKLVIQHAEKDFETFKSFCEGNKCRELYKALARRISCNTLQLMLDKTDFINEPGFLCEAAASRRGDIIEKLRQHGADFNMMNSEGLGALYYACYWGGSLYRTWNRIKALLKVGANINIENSQGNTVLHNLCNAGKNCTETDEDIFVRCAIMIKAGGDPAIKNSAGKTAADLAQEHGLPLTQRLLEEAMSGCRCVQHIAARCKLFDTLDGLFFYSICNIEEQDESGNTVLHVLAALDPLPAEDEVNEIELPYFTAALLRRNRTDVVVVKNNSGETAADVATRANRPQLADMFNAVSSGCIIYDTAVYRQQIEHFSFVSDPLSSDVNERDVNGGTLLHALSRLDTHGRADLEPEVVKLVAELVIEHRADVRIRDNAGETAADVAQSRGWRLLASFLDEARILHYAYRDKLRAKLVYLAVKHRQFDLIKYTWWRYYHCISIFTANISLRASSEFLRELCDCTDSTVTDTDIINALNVIDIYKLVAKCDEDKYQKAIDAANKCGRNELANWLIRHQTNLND